MSGKFAILVDGGFIKKKLQARERRFPTVEDIEAELTRIKLHAALRAFTLLRVYFYDAPPASGRLTNPISGARMNLAAQDHYSQNVSLQQSLEMRSDIALRQGETAVPCHKFVGIDDPIVISVQRGEVGDWRH
jgi:hypothetical protein